MIHYSDTTTTFAPMKTPTVKKKYSEEVISRALAILRDNDYNYKKTSRETTISRDTLRRWAKEYSTPIEEPEVIEVIPEPSEPLPEEIKTLDDAIAAAIKRAKELIPACKTAVEASTVAKTLAKVRLDLTTNTDEANKRKAESLLQATIDRLRKYG